MPRPRPVDGKRCPDCGEFQPPEAFYQSQKYDGGLSTYCKPCHRLRNNQRWVADPEGMRQRSRESYSRTSERDKAKSIAYAKRIRAEDPAKYRSKKFFDGQRNNVAPDVTRAYIEVLFRTITNCQCCGKRLHLAYEDRAMRRFRTDPDAPSVDRVNNRKGYTRSNIAITCWECNFRKTDLTLDDLAMFAKYITRYGDFDVV